MAISEAKARPWTLMLVFGVLSLATVGLGAWVCAASGVATGSWVRNLVAWGVGAVLAAGLASLRGQALRWAVPVAVWVAVLGLAASFFNPDQQGVHRWIDAGPLHVNVAMLLLPAAVVALAVIARGRVWPWLVAGVVLVLLVFQPDASQATAFAGVTALVVLSTVRSWIRWPLLALLVAAVCLAWMRADPMAPVDEVEGIVGLAFGRSPWAGGAALLLLISLALLPVLVSRGAPQRLAGSALGLCFLLWLLTPMFGAFPIPWMGIGMSPIMGAWLGVGLLAATLRGEAAGGG